jgi:divalent metal cation (Fe/Co/Zn/Cd) transporter
VLAAYVTVEAVRDLLVGAEPDASVAGIIMASLSLLVMPALALAKRRVGRWLASATLVADSTETFPCSWLSAVRLVGLMLNATVGWAWADPVAGLGIAWLALREGREAWRGDACG